MPPTGTSKHCSNYMISQHTAQVSQKIIPRRCFKLQCLVGGDELSGIARRRLQGLNTSTPSNARLSSSSTRWKTRQGNDSFARKAKLEGLKSRAAFKLLEVRYISSCAGERAVANYVQKIDAKYKIFKRGQTVVDLVCPPQLLHT